MLVEMYKLFYRHNHNVSCKQHEDYELQGTNQKRGYFWTQRARRRLTVSVVILVFVFNQSHDPQMMGAWTSDPFTSISSANPGLVSRTWCLGMCHDGKLAPPHIYITLFPHRRDGIKTGAETRVKLSLQTTTVSSAVSHHGFGDDLTPVYVSAIMGLVMISPLCMCRPSWVW